MKVFFTPAVDGAYREDWKRRLSDVPDNEIYARVEKYCGSESVDELNDRGYTKMISRNVITGEIDGYWTYQQDDL